LLINTVEFCRVVGIGLDRFEQRRLRERAAADVAADVDGNDLAAMPITPLERGQHGSYDAFDVLRLRSVIELEGAGMAFGAACTFIRRAGIVPSIMFPSSADFYAAQWIGPDGVVRRICGEARDLARALPEAPLVAFKINLTAVRAEVEKRSLALLGLRVVGANFAKTQR
jgi:hypothetical protein